MATRARRGSARAEAIDPDAWESPEAVLQGVSNADALFEKLKTSSSLAADGNRLTPIDRRLIVSSVAHSSRE